MILIVDQKYDITKVYKAIDYLINACYNEIKSVEVGFVESFRSSFSAMSNAITCPWKYAVYNVQKAQVKVESIAKVSGILVHSVLEDFYGAGKDDTSIKRKDQLAWLKTARDNAWVKRFNPRSLELVQEYQDEYAEAIEDTARYQLQVMNKPCKAPTWTAYWKRTYGAYFDEVEATKFAGCYARFSHIRWDTTLMDVYTSTDRCLSNFVPMAARMPKAKQLLIEFKPTRGVEINGLLISGRLDRIAIFEDGTIHVHDFKSGRKRWTPSDIANNDQLMLYAAIVEAEFGVLPTRVGIMDLYNGMLVERAPCPSSLARFYKRVGASVRHTYELHEEIITHGVEKAIEHRGIPLGFGGRFGCPCDLIYEDEGSPVRCPFYQESEDSSGG